MLTKAIKPEIPANLTIKGQGEELKFGITFHNRTEDELDVLRQDPEKTVADVVLYIIKDWESEYDLSMEGLSEMEGARPGMTLAILNAYQQARQVEKVKN